MNSFSPSANSFSSEVTTCLSVLFTSVPVACLLHVKLKVTEILPVDPYSLDVVQSEKNFI